ncbi:S8 family serine peptidase [Streptomyces sp. NA02950]|uniref:S8 family serine peptidase n=1 Tax=Streptomyces sp. NA02950 TaxID=2742137 RepID=UPI0015924EE9|nr:S8 family serine peptidase [Streptomyces sp. NA02950]QKV96020.1 S8 family serine peptidase [Streptomyces sp. NA02950]
MRRPAIQLLVPLTATAALILPVTVTAPPAAAVPAAPSPAPGADGVTLLPPLPVRLGEGKPCTKPSGRTAAGKTWAQSALGLTRTQQLSQGAGVRVAVIDTGVTPGADALSGRVSAVGAGGTDCVGHGTFAAGLIAGARTRGSDVEGMAPQARIIALKGTNDRGVPSPQQVADGIREAADRGAEVIYVGHALRTGKAELTQATAYAARHDALVVAPAAPDAVPREELGPDGRQPTGPYWPAAAPGVLSVVDFGPSGLRQKDAPPAYAPDLSAPGSTLVSIGPRGSGHYIGSGASLGAACTAGAAALVRAHHPRMSAENVARQLMETAYPADIPRLDPYAAMTMTLAHGKADRAAPPSAHLPPPADPAPGVRSAAVAFGSLALALLLAAAAAVIPRGRARGWLPPGRQREAGPSSR